MAELKIHNSEDSNLHSDETNIKWEFNNAYLLFIIFHQHLIRSGVYE
jgi:hypothetical protein